MRKILLFIAILTIFTAGTYAQLTLPITDNFPSSGAEQSWDDYDSSYEDIQAFSPSAPSGDGYVMDVNDGNGWQYIHLNADDGSLGDYVVTAYIYLPVNATTWSRCGIHARTQDPASAVPGGYYLFADTDGDDYLRVGLYGAGHVGWTNYVDPPGTITRDAWHKWELLLSGNIIEARIDDSLFYAGTDATDHATGYMGILNYMTGTAGSHTLCDRITVEEATPVKNWSLME